MDKPFIRFYPSGGAVLTDRVCSICKSTSIWKIVPGGVFGCLSCSYVYDGEDEQDVSEEIFEQTKELLHFIKKYQPVNL